MQIAILLFDRFTALDAVRDPPERSQRLPLLVAAQPRPVRPRQVIGASVQHRQRFIDVRRSGSPRPVGPGPASIAITSPRRGGPGA